MYLRYSVGRGCWEFPILPRRKSSDDSHISRGVRSYIICSMLHLGKSIVVLIFSLGSRVLAVQRSQKAINRTRSSSSHSLCNPVNNRLDASLSHDILLPCMFNRPLRRFLYVCVKTSGFFPHLVIISLVNIYMMSNTSVFIQGLNINIIFLCSH